MTIGRLCVRPTSGMVMSGRGGGGGMDELPDDDGGGAIRTPFIGAVVRGCSGLVLLLMIVALSACVLCARGCGLVCCVGVSC